jgi:SagB-type dehydrogenase family enzyme
MPNFHEKTNHSYKSVRQNQFFLDWNSQPKTFKQYPHFYKRYKISDYEQLENLELINCITYKKDTPQGSYTLRTVPSAGALYPCEIYLQIRGIKGIISGIYHYEISTNSICLLQEIENDGCEYYFKNQNIKKGISFFISASYFRSSWKYKNRAIRYILLDSGHQLGSIYCYLAIQNKTSLVDFDFDKLALNQTFGFKDEELFLASIHNTNSIEKIAKPLKQNLPYVCACDYIENNDFIYSSYQDSVQFHDKNFDLPNFFENINKEDLKSTILNRRSIRAFYKLPITKDEFDFIIKDLISFANKNNIDLFYTVHMVEDLEIGLYKNNNLISQADFSRKSGYLSLEQALGQNSAVTFYFTSNEKVKYQKVNILSGFIAHIIYIKSTLKNIGCSGIGAYYDQEAKDFLKTDNNILYMLAIGR